ncbi:hypothetical protein PUNSTDRAFT_139026 [Punctularia strigosozonata HHB-11173 SS5]|uniref:Uncharacterized protein n=1 Tax=Punctularia strigosozonata (strain HHB-11173) TaxID=741275 RepID=R7S0R9_PUNST|nr:uncharacterized protein PUNSTDRAFT_139026 [Punctularia strigosozonata HHB-11173 SS5]EIN03985.1 hypothetical protein PUNSTDRAFT_139026 [Punctularia strigosozonata HHB-11173 SS5]
MDVGKRLRQEHKPTMKLLARHPNFTLQRARRLIESFPDEILIAIFVPSGSQADSSALILS